MPETSNDSVSFKALREYCKELGLTGATIGMSIDEMIAQARKTDNPRAWLAALVDAPPDEDLADEPAAVTVAVAEAPPPRAVACGIANTRMLDLRIPISLDECPAGMLSNLNSYGKKVDVNLQGVPAMAFWALQDALNRGNVRLHGPHGPHVGASWANVLRWLCYEIAAAIEKSIEKSGEGNPQS